MRNFIIWPILVPALGLFCRDEAHASQAPGQGIELDMPGTTSGETSSPRGRWDDTGYDDILQQKPLIETDASGTVVDEGDDSDLYVEDLYGDQTPYDDQDVDDEANDGDDSNMSR